MSRAFGLLALGALGLAAIIVGLNLAARRRDNGALVVECGTLRPYPGPVLVELDPSAAEHREAFAEALRSWAGDGALLGLAVPAQPSALAQFSGAMAGDAPEPVGRVLVVSLDVGAHLVERWGDTAGHARLRWDPRTCRLGYAVIVLDDAEHSAEEWRAVAEHEIGHVLGLAHDPSPASVMRHPVRSDARITEYDAALVQARAHEVSL